MISAMVKQKTYSVPLVGVSQYQHAIAAVGEGEAVQLLREPDNPHDEEAIAAVCHGDTIGYVGRGSWLRRAIIDEGKGCCARILSVHRGLDAVGVSLSVQLSDNLVGERDYEGAGET